MLNKISKFEKILFFIIFILIIIFIYSMNILNNMSREYNYCKDYGFIHETKTKYIFSEKACYYKKDGKIVKLIK